MAEIMLSKPGFARKKRETTLPGNIAYAVFVLFCFWVGAQILNLLVHAPGVFDHLMQMQENGRPRIEMGLAVSTLFGVVPFLLGCVMAGAFALYLRLRQRFF
ncbi:DUF2755 family protein [Franconibacter pulveris 1160]|jgi:hypothetical protein|uniref:Membrane protein n=2 Tax=Franconibacter TaxID=1649295 RepID=A0A0J8VTJ3_9ENTR|nr:MULTISPECIES: DUF2755 family protein [Franconibacter]KMV36332.1 membrane protein [Franconibacter pulveris]MCK1966986.1 YaiY family protein [Franconibacter sp. IITDAS19]MEB5921608.1 YaiY family protein [Franconibacter daqui]GGD07658.1 membrane protein [Franconibacter daqui]HBI10113.1 DUF2755 domain-containing protein [Franconibacter pulveris]